MEGRTLAGSRTSGQTALLRMRATTTRWVAVAGIATSSVLLVVSLLTGQPTERILGLALSVVPFVLPLLVWNRWQRLQAIWISLGLLAAISVGVLSGVGSGLTVQFGALILTVLVAGFCWSAHGALTLAALSSLVLWFAPPLAEPDGERFATWLKLSGILLTTSLLVYLALRTLESALRREQAQERRAAQIIQCARDGLMVLEPGGGVRLVNPAAEEMGARRGADGLRFLRPEAERRVRAELEQLRGELMHLRAEDENRVFEAHLIALQETDGGREWLLTLSDVSERLAAEESRRVLAERIRESRSLESLGRLAGGIAHDFNNLLTIVTGVVELLLDREDLDAAVREELAQIGAASSRGAALTAQLLAVARRQVLRPQVLDPRGVIEGLMPLLTRLAPASVRLECHLGEEASNVRVDRAQLEQVLVNLVSNACDAMPRGGLLTIEVKSRVFDASDTEQRPEVQPGRYAMIAVSDTGEGMSSQTVNKIFEPFFTTKKERGTGLGLATVHGIVQQSGGYVYVYSEPGKGSCFRIYFPATESPVSESLPDNPQILRTHPSLPVLLVEDQREVRDSVRKMLESLGCRVSTASRGDEAIEIFQRSPQAFRLLVTDVVMPHMSGPEIAAHLTARAPALAVLYMSGYTGNAIIDRGVLENGAECINKPFRRLELSAAMARVLEQVRSRLSEDSQSDQGDGGIGRDLE